MSADLDASTARPAWTPLRAALTITWTVVMLGLLFILVSAVPGYWAKCFAGQSPYELQGVDGELRVSAVSPLDREPDGQVLEVGQRVVSIDGATVDARMGRQALDALTHGPPGSLHTWVVEGSSGEPAEVQVLYEHSALARDLHSWVSNAVRVSGSLTAFPQLLRSLITLLAALVLGLFAITRGKHTLIPVSLGLAAYGARAGLEEGLHPDWHFALQDIAGLMASVAVAYALLALPSGALRLRWSRALLVFWVGMELLVLDPLLLPWEGLRASPWEWPARLALICLGLASMLYRYLRQSTPQEQAQIQWLAYGAVCCLASFATNELNLLGYGLLHHSYKAVVHPLIMGLAVLALCAPLLVYRIWDLCELSRGTLLWVSFTVILIICSTLMTELLGVLLAEVWPSLDRGDSWVGLGLMVATFLGAAVPVFMARGLVLRSVDLLFFPNVGNLERSVSEGPEVLLDCSTMTEVAWSITAILRHGWDVDRVELWVDKGEEGWVRERCSGREEPVGLGEPPFLGVLDTQLRSGEWAQLPNPQTEDGTPEVLLVPVVQQEVLIGVLLVEPSLTGGGLSSRERRSLGALTGPLCAALTRCLPVPQRIALYAAGVRL